MTDLHRKTASELAPLIKTKQLSPVKLSEAIIKRAKEEDPLVNAYITLTPDTAREQAKHVEKQIMQGLYLGPLHGIPIAIKDNMYTKGIPTTAGSKLLHDFLPNENATTVDKLLAAGGIMIGKLNMHEFGGGLTNTNQFYGNARNPWDLNHTPRRFKRRQLGRFIRRANNARYGNSYCLPMPCILPLPVKPATPFMRN